MTGAREAGWNRLGVRSTGLNATQAFQQLGQFDTELVPMTAMFGGQVFDQGYRMIMRHPNPQSNVAVPFGVVGPGYDLVTPYDLVTTLDFALGEREVSVIGAPDGGKMFYVGYDMPEGKVQGEDIRNTLLVSSPNDGKGALRMTVFALRLICTNGLTAQVATESYTLRHGMNVVKTLAKWVEGLWPRSIQRSQELQAAFEAMTQRRVDERMFHRMILKLLPTPNMPAKTPSATTDAKRLIDWQYRSERVAKDRQGIARLFSGEGLGMDSPAAAGTAWGFYNAVAEYYDHGRDVRNVDRQVAEAMFGEFADLKAAAFELALK